MNTRYATAGRLRLFFLEKMPCQKSRKRRFHILIYFVFPAYYVIEQIEHSRDTRNRLALLPDTNVFKQFLKQRATSTTVEAACSCAVQFVR